MVTTWEWATGYNLMLCSLAVVTHIWLHNKLFPTPDEVRAVFAGCCHTSHMSGDD